MSEYSRLNISPVKWEQVKAPVEKISPSLAKIIDDWNPPYQLYEATYPYGALITKEGEFYLSSKNNTPICLQSKEVPTKLQEDLSYSSLPLGLVLNNTVEVYRDLDEAEISLGIFNPGTPMGLLETLEPPKSFCIRNVWTVSAGIRSVFMLPKISDKTLHGKAVKAIKCNAPVPRKTSDHFETFKAIAYCFDPEASWHVKLLLFGSQWFKPNYDNHHWLLFNDFLHEYLFKHASLSRNAITLDIIWHRLSHEWTKQSKRIDTNVLDTVKHLVKIALGAIPAFAPVVDDLGGPFSLLQKFYVENYKIQYSPTIMAAKHFTLGKHSQPVYYSLSKPMQLESIPKNRKPESLITDLIQVASLVRDFMFAFNKGSLGLQNTLVGDILSAVKFSCFHNVAEDEKYFGIEDSAKIAEEDKCFLSYPCQLPFAGSNAFLRNSVRISAKHF